MLVCYLHGTPVVKGLIIRDHFKHDLQYAWCSTVCDKDLEYSKAVTFLSAYDHLMFNSSSCWTCGVFDGICQTEWRTFNLGAVNSEMCSLHQGHNVTSVQHPAACRIFLWLVTQPIRCATMSCSSKSLLVFEFVIFIRASRRCLSVRLVITLVD
jgi:hypothetical protein